MLHLIAFGTTCKLCTMAAFLGPWTSVSSSSASFPLHTITTFSQIFPDSDTRVFSSSVVKVLMYLAVPMCYITNKGSSYLACSCSIESILGVGMTHHNTACSDVINNILTVLTLIRDSSFFCMRRRRSLVT